MNVVRNYYVSESLDDLEAIEQQLEAAGVTTPQIHVLTLDEGDAAHHVNLNSVSSLMHKDVVRSGRYGAVVGAIGAVAVLAGAALAGWTDSVAGWIPFVFLAIVVFGFCTWEGGFIGIQRPNTKFKRFEKELKAGRHVLFVDVTPDQTATLHRIAVEYPGLKPAGEESGTPAWVMSGQKRFTELVTETLP